MYLPGSDLGHGHGGEAHTGRDSYTTEDWKPWAPRAGRWGHVCVALSKLPGGSAASPACGLQNQPPVT